MHGAAGCVRSSYETHALALNLLVATIGTVRFHLAAVLPWRKLLPFVIGSVPLAVLGGAVRLPERSYHLALGGFLALAALRLVWTAHDPDSQRIKEPLFVVALVTGALVGLASGLLGIGGGILITPIVLFERWASMREAAGMSAAFILINSAAGLIGNFASVRFLPAALPMFLVVAAIGGTIGAYLGSQRLAPRTLRYMPATVLLSAAVRPVQ